MLKVPRCFLISNDISNHSAYKPIFSRITKQVVPISIQNKRTIMLALTPLNITEKMLLYPLLDGRMYLIPSHFLCINSKAKNKELNH